MFLLPEKGRLGIHKEEGKMPILRIKDAVQAKKSCHKDQGEVIVSKKMEKAAQEAQESIKQLQMIEQNLQNILAQKQAFQAQLIEVESALSELEKAKTAYKIVGNIMVAANADELKSDLTSKKEMAEVRIRTLEKQEEKMRETASDIQSKVLEKLGKK